MTRQPTWKCVANLGDVNPIDHGGAFVYIDQTGVYPAELEILEVPNEGEKQEWVAYRFIMEPCTFINGVLSDNSYHPEYPAWFADDIDQTARQSGMDTEQLIDLLCSAQYSNRATGWIALYNHHGGEKFDSDPLTFSKFEVCRRYRHILRRLRSS